jgi:hypothetical protein
MPSPSEAKPARNLYQKIATVQANLGDVEATGRSQYANSAISIGDVEHALRPLLADVGVVTRWQYVGLEQLDKALWRAHLRVIVSDGETSFEDEWIDVGGNPMAATSFARKGYLKALFHLSEERDESGSTGTLGTPTTLATATGRPQAPRNGPPPNTERGPLEGERAALLADLMRLPHEQRMAIMRSPSLGVNAYRGQDVKQWAHDLSDSGVAAIQRVLTEAARQAAVENPL